MTTPLVDSIAFVCLTCGVGLALLALWYSIPPYR